ncbi:hypothetical protein TNCV_4576831 [Trichonephila clavipes]|nr:hypothetical protein TNCV_4576831 [Trichonephila clavipes]
MQPLPMKKCGFFLLYIERSRREKTNYSYKVSARDFGSWSSTSGLLPSMPLHSMKINLIDLGFGNVMAWEVKSYEKMAKVKENIYASKIPMTFANCWVNVLQEEC